MTRPFVSGRGVRAFARAFLPVLVLCLLLSPGLTPAAFAKPEAAPGSHPPAVLIVAFGTSVEAARVAYADVEKGVRAAFPGAEIRWAWTAHSLLAANNATPMPTAQEALARLAAEGAKDVAVLSLHVIPGSEYQDLRRTAEALEGLPKGLERIRLAPPLLHDADSLRAVAEKLLGIVPAGRGPEEAVLFVGHGSHHPAGVFYPALQYYLGALDANALVGAIESDPGFDAVLAALRARNATSVWLIPLMTVAGDHASNDLFGAEPESWRQRLEANGIRVHAVPRGLGEQPALVERWVAGLKQAE